MVDLGVFTISLKGNGDPVFKPWENKVMNLIFASEDAISSRTAHEAAPEVSRAAVIFFLEEMHNAGVLEVTYKSGKGGYAAQYRPTLDKAELYRRIASEAQVELEKWAKRRDAED